jgi:hypothetical protein
MDVELTRRRGFTSPQEPSGKRQSPLLSSSEVPVAAFREVPETNEEDTMERKTVTATYESTDAVRNVVDELLEIGIPQEKFFAEKDKNQIKVIIPEAGESMIVELLKRHHPKTLH